MREPPIVRPPGATSDQDPPQVGSVAPRMQSATTAAKPLRWGWLRSADKRWIVLTVLFAATAALGLPLLWRSQAFSKPEKWLWSIVVICYTAIVFWLFYLVMAWSWRQISESLAL